MSLVTCHTHNLLGSTYIEFKYIRSNNLPDAWFFRFNSWINSSISNKIFCFSGLDLWLSPDISSQIFIMIHVFLGVVFDQTHGSLVNELNIFCLVFYNLGRPDHLSVSAWHHWASNTSLLELLNVLLVYKNFQQFEKLARNDTRRRVVMSQCRERQNKTRGLRGKKQKRVVVWKQTGFKDWSYYGGWYQKIDIYIYISFCIPPPSLGNLKCLNKFYICKVTGELTARLVVHASNGRFQQQQNDREASSSR